MQFLRNASSFSTRSAVALVILIAVGFAGNYFNFPVFFGSSFLFGSIAVFLVLALYGLGWALLASLIAASYTVILFNSPYTLITLALETFAVGLVLRRRCNNIAFIDALFWLLLGIPLGWMLRYESGSLNALGAWYITLKQALNGFANALIASFVLQYLPIRKWAGVSSAIPEVPLNQKLSNLLVAFVVFPVLLLLLVENQEDSDEFKADAGRDLSGFSTDVSYRLASFHQRRLIALNNLAEIVAAGTASPETMRRQLDVTKGVIPDFDAIFVGDASGKVVMATGSADMDDLSKADFSGEAWFKELKASRRSAVSNAMVSRMGQTPVISLGVPLLQGNAQAGVLRGYVAAFLRLDQVGRILKQRVEGNSMRATVLDAQGNVIATTRSGMRQMQPFDLNKTGAIKAADGQVYKWWSPTGDANSVRGWKDSFYVLDSAVPNTPYRLIVETPVEPYQAALQKINVRAFAFLAIMVALAYFIGAAVSRIVSRPLSQLAQATSDFQAAFREGRELSVPESPVQEINDLMHHFREMADTLNRSYRDLEQRVDERTHALSEMNRQLEREIAARGQYESVLKEHARILESTADALRRKEQEQTTLLDNLPDMVWFRDAESRYMFVNRAFEQATGLTSEALRGQKSTTVFLEDEAAGCVSDDAQARNAHQTLVKEKTLTLKGAEPRVYLTTRTPLFDEVGDFTGTIGVFHDITERKRNEEALKKTLAELGRQKFALDQHAIVSVADAAGNIIYTNDKFSEISGYSREELLGKNHRILNSGYHSPEFFRDMWITISQGEVWQGIIRNRSKDGSYYWVDSTIVPFMDMNGVPYRYVSIRTDFTDIKQAEEKLIDAKEAAEQASQAKSAFLSRMSHELRTPLNAILGFAQLLENDPDDPASPSQQENLQHILKAGWHLLELINDVLDMSRIEAGKMSMNMESVALSPLLAECVDLVTQMASARQIQLLDATVSCAPYLVIADCTRLQQVLLNLLSNAVKYNRDNGTVTISCEKSSSGKLRVSIADTGMGIDQEQQKQLFEVFSRLDADKTNIEGTGIGLAISKRMTELMGGTIGVESTPGQGSIFWIELQLADSMETANDDSVG